MGIVIGVVIAAAGAILRYATNATVSHLNLHMTGLILMIAGAAIAVLSLIVHLARRERVIERSVDRVVAPPTPVAVATRTTDADSIPVADSSAAPRHAVINLPADARPAVVEEPARVAGTDPAV